jgi:hypothetical protein
MSVILGDVLASAKTKENFGVFSSIQPPDKFQKCLSAALPPPTGFQPPAQQIAQQMALLMPHQVIWRFSMHNHTSRKPEHKHRRHGCPI